MGPKMGPKTVSREAWVATLVPRGAPEAPPKAQGSLQEAIWSYFCFNFHTFSTNFGSIF